MRRAALVIASILVSVLFLWLALQGVPIDDVLASIAGADPFWVAVGFLCVPLGLAARGMRWSRGLLDGRLRAERAWHILNIGMLLNQVPLRAGEVARGVLAAREGVPFVTAATSIVVERLIDVLVCVLLLTIGIARVPEAPALIAQTSLAFGAAAVVGFIVLIALARSPALARRLIGGVEARLPMLARFHLTQRADEVFDGLRPFSQPRRMAVVLFWTAVGWGISLVSFYALERALDVQGVDLFTGSLLAVAMASFSIAIPISVAAIGPFQTAVRVAGDAVGMAALDSTTLGFLFHGVSIAGYALFGVIGFLRIGVSLSEAIRRDAPAPAPSPTQD